MDSINNRHDIDSPSTPKESYEDPDGNGQEIKIPSSNNRHTLS